MTISAKRIGLWAVLLVLAILGIAWIDGGEQPLRPIEHTVMPQGEGS